MDVVAWISLVKVQSNLPSITPKVWSSAAWRYLQMDVDVAALLFTNRLGNG